MYNPDKQQSHSKRYEGLDLVQHKTQALLAWTDCNLWVPLNNCLCISASISARLLLGLQSFQPTHQPSCAPATDLLNVWILFWEVAQFTAGAPEYFSYPAQRRVKPWTMAPSLKRWQNNITRDLSHLAQVQCLCNKQKRQSLLPLALFLVAVVTAVADMHFIFPWNLTL